MTFEEMENKRIESMIRVLGKDRTGEKKHSHKEKIK